MTDLRRDISLFVSVARLEAALHVRRLELQRIPQEIAVIDRALAELDAREKAAATDLDGLKKTRLAVEKTLHEHEDQLARCRSQLPQLKRNEDYTAMLKEIGNLEKSVDAEEERLLILMDDIERRSGETERAREQIAADRAKRSEERKVLESRAAVLASESERFAREKPGILAEISPALLRRYERVAERHGDVAVVRVEADHCGACRHQIPPQVAVEIRKNDQFIACPFCGRILIHYAD